MNEQVKMDFNAPHPPLILRGGEGELRLTHEERKVWEILQSHRGKKSAIQGPKVSAMTAIPYDRVRFLISHFVTEHGLLIASCGLGYYVPVTPDEVAEATRSLRHRGIMILMRAARLQKLSLEDVFGQARIEFKNGD